MLAGVSTAVGAALLHSGTLSVLLTAFHTGCSEATGLLRGGAVPLLHTLHRLQELTARQALVVFLRKERLKKVGRRRKGGGGRRRKRRGRRRRREQRMREGGR